MPELDYDEITVNVTSSSNTLADSGLSIDITVAANSEPIWIEYGCTAVSNNAANGGGVLALFEDSTRIDSWSWIVNTASAGTGFTRRTRRNPTAGPHTYKVQIATLFSGTLTVQADTDGDPGPFYLSAFRFDI